jgi:hypothetical protein
MSCALKLDCAAVARWHDPRSPIDSMNSRTRLALIAAGAALVTLRPALVESPLMVQAPATTSAADRRAVRIEHELVTVPVVERPAVRHQRAAASRATALPRRTAHPRGIVARTRQFFLGDGRYRPEPFPRAGR